MKKNVSSASFYLNVINNIDEGDKNFVFLSFTVIL